MLLEAVDVAGDQIVNKNVMTREDNNREISRSVPIKCLMTRMTMVKIEVEKKVSK